MQKPTRTHFSVAHPGLVVILKDESGSTDKEIQSIQIATLIAASLNLLLRELVLLARDDEGGVQDVLRFACLGYSGSGVEPCFVGPLAARNSIRVTDLSTGFSRIEEVTTPSGATLKNPIWVESKSLGGTPMVAAFTRALHLVEEFARDHPDSAPPIIINITDGKSTDGDIRLVTEKIRQVRTHHGPAVVFNIHVSPNCARQILFPAAPPRDAGTYAPRMYEASSELPAHMYQEALRLELPVSPGARALCVNADPVCLLQALKVGSLSSMRAPRKAIDSLAMEDQR
jgi:hypothetical protein